MADVLRNLREKPGLISKPGASEEQIQNAETLLRLKFAKEYKEYVSAFGAVAYDGHELTGICASSRINVVNVTEEERPKYSGLPKDWYVLEQLNIDDVSIWQASSGEVYQLMPGTKPIKVSSSLSEYISG